MTSIHNIVKAPEGTKMWLLHLGNLEADEGWVLRGVSLFRKTLQNPLQEKKNKQASIPSGCLLCKNKSKEKEKAIRHIPSTTHLILFRTKTHSHLLQPMLNSTKQGSTTTHSNPNAPRSRLKLAMISILIDHPSAGLLLYETGAGKDYPETVGPPANDIFARVDHDPNEFDLDKAIKKCGRDIRDVKGVIMGHMHLDHAGGLEHFEGTDVPVYVHERELKHAWFSVVTKSDLGTSIVSHASFNGFCGADKSPTATVL